MRPTTAGPPPTGECPFCPGNESLTRPEISAYRKDGSPPDTPGWSVRVVPEIDPYFGVEHELVREGIGLYDRVSPRGATELIVESPEHGDAPATMREEQWEQVLWMYRERLRDLKRDQQYSGHPGDPAAPLAGLAHHASLLAAHGHPDHLRRRPQEAPAVP